MTNLRTGAKKSVNGYIACFHFLKLNGPPSFRAEGFFMWYRKRDDVPIPASRFQERGKNMIRYELAEDIGAKISDILRTLRMTHVDESRVACVRSIGSNSRRTIARCHGLSRIMQLALNQKPHYVIEVVSERFDKLSKEEQTKILIHELMHIPQSFGGGFRTHKPYVTQKMVERMYRKFVRDRAPFT